MAHPAAAGRSLPAHQPQRLQRFSRPRPAGAHRRGAWRGGAALHADGQPASGPRAPAGGAAGAPPVALTLLGERYVQLGPAWRSGPTLRDGDSIPLARTSVPVEIDELLRGLERFTTGIDPKRAGDVVTDVARLVEGRGGEVNDLIANAAGTLDLLADKGEDIKAIIASLRDLSSTLRGRTDYIEALIRNYDLVTQVLIDNKDDLNGVITQLDRASVELTRLVAAHQDPLRSDVKVLAKASSTVAANEENLRLTLASTVKLFEAAGRAYEDRTRSLRVNNQLSPELTSDILAARLRDRIAGLCRRLGIATCSDPASPLLNEVVGLLPQLLAGTDQQTGGPPPAPPSTPTPTVPTPSVPSLPGPTLPTDAELLAALAKQLTDGLDAEQQKLLEALDGERLAALLGLDPTLLQILNDLDRDQIDRLRTADPKDIQKVMLELYNEVKPPSERLEPLLPPATTTPVGPTIPGLGPIVDGLSSALGG